MCDQDRAFITESADTLSSKNVLKVKKFIERLSGQERKVPAKNVMFVTACNVLVEQIEQKIVPFHYDYNNDFVKLSSAIKSKSIQEIGNIFHILTSFENASQVISLISKFLKGQVLIRYVKTFSLKTAVHTLSLKRAQLSRYIAFYKLVCKYQWLIYINLDFTQITKNIKQKKKIMEMEQYEIFKQPCPLLGICFDPHPENVFDNTSD